MIARLISVELAAFRCFRERQTIPLNGDVVLIQGLNGTGKTSLLNAIELALTGKVLELARFDSDYPRCLKNVDSSDNGSVSVTYQSEDGSDMVLETELSTTTIQSSKKLSESDAQFFIDRCYLSQTSLGRLLENYQAYSSDSPEQPLVRFIRELLGLDLLENITGGLHEVALITRIENSVPELARLREEERALKQRASKLRAELPAYLASWQKSLIAVQQLCATAGDPLPNASWDPEGISARMQTYSSAAPEAMVSVELQKIRRAEGRIQRALGLLGASDAPAGVAALTDRLRLLTNRQQQLEERIRPSFDQARSILTATGVEMSPSENLDVDLRAVERALQTAEGSATARSEFRNRTKKEIDQLEKQAAAYEQEIASLSPKAGSERALVASLVDILSSILQHVHGDDCPVCERDYSEMRQGSLREHILARIEALGANARELEQIAKRNETATVGLRSTRSQIAALVDAVRREEGNAKDLPDPGTIRQVAGAVSALSETLEEWIETRDRINVLRTELRSAEIQERERSSAAEEITSVFAEYGSQENLRRSDIRVFAQSIADMLRHRAELLEKQLAAMGNLREALRTTTADGASWGDADRELNNSLKRLNDVQRALTQTEHIVDSARNLSRAATRAKTRTLNRVFNQELNNLWQQLFRRLVKHESFQPQLHEPKTVRGQIRTTIGAWRQGIDPFEQFAAIASSGNLNTAALSLFLSLHLIEKPRHRVLLLDDPIQNIDDLHVVQLANLLREIRRQAQRQLVIAVHEKALFDYLCIELGPVSPGATLQTIELERRANDVIEITAAPLRVWKSDTVKFGSEPAAAVVTG